MCFPGVLYLVGRGDISLCWLVCQAEGSEHIMGNCVIFLMVPLEGVLIYQLDPNQLLPHFAF